MQTKIGSDIIASYSSVVADASHVGEVRRALNVLGTTQGFDETIRGRVAVIATELTRNVVIHAGGGEIFARAIEREGVKGVEVITVDRGPGMGDLSRCMQDGFSTAGTAGIGLGAVERLSTEFEIYSSRGAGTVVVSRVWPKADLRPLAGDGVGVLCVPKPGETACGDAWAVIRLPGRSFVLVADGLGHGPFAAEASAEAVRLFEVRDSDGPKDILDRIHGGLRKTRGAAAAVAELNEERGVVRFSGIGNISAMLCNREKSHLMSSHNGIVGHTAGRVQEFAYPLGTDPMLIMTSDGINTRWRLDSYPGLVGRDVGLVSGVLFRDFRRDRDDSTVLVLRPLTRGAL